MGTGKQARSEPTLGVSGGLFLYQPIILQDFVVPTCMSVVPTYPPEVFSPSETYHPEISKHLSVSTRSRGLSIDEWYPRMLACRGFRCYLLKL